MEMWSSFTAKLEDTYSQKYPGELVSICELSRVQIRFPSTTSASIIVYPVSSKDENDPNFPNLKSKLYRANHAAPISYSYS